MIDHTKDLHIALVIVCTAMVTGFWLGWWSVM